MLAVGQIDFAGVWCNQDCRGVQPGADGRFAGSDGDRQLGTTTKHIGQCSSSNSDGSDGGGPGDGLGLADGGVADHREGETDVAAFFEEGSGFLDVVVGEFGVGRGGWRSIGGKWVPVFVVFAGVDDAGCDAGYFEFGVLEVDGDVVLVRGRLAERDW